MNDAALDALELLPVLHAMVHQGVEAEEAQHTVQRLRAVHHLLDRVERPSETAELAWF